MDSEELSRWLAYDKLDLIPDAWLIGGTICTVLVRMLGKDAGRIKPEDFIPRGKPVRIMSGDAGRAIFEGITTAQRLKAERERD